MKFLKFISNNWRIKIVALIVATGMWVYAASIGTNIAKFPSAIPIGVVNLTPGYTAIFDQSEVKIEIAAEPVVWQKLSASSFTAFIDLNGYSVGTYEIPVGVTTQIADLSIISKDPNVVVVTIEPAVEKELPVVAKIDGDAALNLIVGDVVFDPQTVKISGPESIIAGISQATAEIILAGESQDFSKAIKLVSLDNKNQPIDNVSFSPKSVIANIKIVKAGNVKNVGVKVVTDGLPADGYFVSSVSTSPAIVPISGAPNIIRTISSIATSPVDLGGSNQAITRAVSLQPPLGVAIDGEQTTVLVTITISPMSTTKMLTIPITVVNIPAGLKLISLSLASVEVVISGQANVVGSTEANTITLSLNLSAGHSGENNLIINSGNFSLPAGISISSISSQSILVKLE